MTPQMQQGIQRARAAGVPEDKIQERIRQLQSQGGQLPATPPKTPMSVGGFAGNVARDIGDNVKGLASLPALAVQAVKNPIKTGEAVAGGMVQEYVDLASNPVETAYEKPISTALNVLPIAGAVKKFAGAGKVATAAKAADTAGDVGRVANIADEASIAKVLKDVGGVADPKQVGDLSRQLYQQALSFSKKGNSFERFKPAETANSMVYYGIQGSADEIARKASMVSGRDGILSRVVNESVGSVQKPVDISLVRQYFATLDSGVFSELDPKKISEVEKRLNRLTPKSAAGTVDASQLLDFERALQSEGFSHLLDANKGGRTGTAELGRLKLELADEIAKVIDDSVVDVKALDKFNDPRIIQELAEISPKLAEEYQAAIRNGSVQGIRSLQSPFVRIQKIVELAQNEASSLGTAFFKGLNSVPMVGPVLDSLAASFGPGLMTSLAVGLEGSAKGRLAKSVGGAVMNNMSKPGAGVGFAGGFATGGVPGAIAGTAIGGLLGNYFSSAKRAGLTTLIGRQSGEMEPDPELQQITESGLTQGLGASPDMASPSQMVTIRNSETGETKQVPASQLGDFGIGGGSNIPSKEQIQQAIVEDFINNKGKNLDKLIKLESYLHPKGEEGDVGEIMLETLKTQFNQISGVSSNEMEASLTAPFRKAQASLGGDQALRVYNDLKKPIALALAVRIQGSRPTDNDVQAAMGLLPSENDTAETAQQKFRTVEQMLQLPPNTTLTPEDEDELLGY